MAGSVNWKLVLLVAVVLPTLAVQGRTQGPKQLQIHAHESHAGPSNTFVISAAPPGDTNGTDEFGVIKTFSNLVRESSDNTSTVIGAQIGIVVIGKDEKDVFLSYTWSFNANATYQGTIAVIGHIVGTSTVDRAFAVVGGTGDFLAVTGEDTSPFDFIIPPPTDVNIHTVTLFYPSN